MGRWSGLIGSASWLPGLLVLRSASCSHGPHLRKTHLACHRFFRRAGNAWCGGPECNSLSRGELGLHDHFISTRPSRQDCVRGFLALSNNALKLTKRGSPLEGALPRRLHQVALRSLAQCSTDGVRLLRSDATDLLHLEYTLEPGDVEAWWLARSRHGRVARVNYWLTVAMFVAGSGWVFTLLAAQFVQLSAPVRVIAAALGVVAGWGLAEVTLRTWYRAMAGEHSSTGKGPSQFGAHTLEISPEGISEAGPSGRHSHSWRAFESLLETRDHIFLTVAGGFAYAVPKRGLPPEALGKLRDAVRFREQGQDRNGAAVEQADAATRSAMAKGRRGPRS